MICLFVIELVDRPHDQARMRNRGHVHALIELAIELFEIEFLMFSQPVAIDFRAREVQVERIYAFAIVFRASCCSLAESSHTEQLEY